ncbi:MAG: shikimate dehydrogenase [Candidatus Bathyarchaeia archaeon]
MVISGKTQVYGVIGDPIQHTLSPAMHNAAFSHLKLDYIYLAFRVQAADLENAMRGIRSLGIRGLNVTMPHKTAVTAYLDKIDSTVKFLGSANTILNKDGKLYGFNTDGEGASRALKENGVDFNGKTVLLLGAGGAAKAIAHAIAQEASELRILNRAPEKAQWLASELNRAFGNKVISDALSPSTIKENMRGADVLINATSVGMHPNINESLVSPHWLNSEMCVMDIVYNPLETKLARDAKAAGARVISGLEMLLYQGAASFEIWTGRKAPIEIMRAAALTQITRGASV